MPADAPRLPEVPKATPVTGLVLSKLTEPCHVSVRLVANASAIKIGNASKPLFTPIAVFYNLDKEC